MRNGRIITVGLSPAWDIVCRGRGLQWGRHQTIDEQVVRPAGKALNVSYALAWMGAPSIAAGLWGRDDCGEMEAGVGCVGGRIEVRMTAVEGKTRRNITVVDALHRREMHLRAPSDLASADSLRKLAAGLAGLVRPGDTCVFAGAMPAGDLLSSTVELVRTCHRCGARIAADTYGPVFKEIVNGGLAWLIAPNVEELRELLGSQVEDAPASLAEAARTLLGRVELALISRGEQGALLVTKVGVWTACSTVRREVLSTVGCGDYLLAGFLAGLAETGDPQVALTQGLKAATARAWGWTETRTWAQVEKEVAVAVETL
ncbi:MAG: PfkB family carbohydrate kinase [Phycisphaerales bacterium]